MTVRALAIPVRREEERERQERTRMAEMMPMLKERTHFREEMYEAKRREAEAKRRAR